MSVELPRDAEGREIPLDTVELFGGNGNAYNITGWMYVTDFDSSNSTAGQWRALTDKFSRLDPELMYLTPPDSLEKLEEDLGKILNHPKKIVCAYFNRERKDCDGCKLENCEGSCAHACLEDIMTRIHELRGDN